jgi:hypothetical protein
MVLALPADSILVLSMIASLTDFPNLPAPKSFARVCVVLVVEVSATRWIIPAFACCSRACSHDVKWERSTIISLCVSGELKYRTARGRVGLTTLLYSQVLAHVLGYVFVFGATTQLPICSQSS